MNLATARSAYYEASGTASSIARQLALAGIAVIWLLSGALVNSHVQLTTALLTASLLMLTALLFDLLQYVWVGGAFSVWSRRCEMRLDALPRPARSGARVVPNPPRLARMLQYPPVPPEPLQEPEGNEREIGETPNVILQVTWVLFSAKILFMVAAYALVGVSLIHRITVS